MQGHLSAYAQNGNSSVKIQYRLMHIQPWHFLLATNTEPSMVFYTNLNKQLIFSIPPSNSHAHSYTK